MFLTVKNSCKALRKKQKGLFRWETGFIYITWRFRHICAKRNLCEELPTASHRVLTASSISCCTDSLIRQAGRCKLHADSCFEFSITASSFEAACFSLTPELGAGNLGRWSFESGVIWGGGGGSVKTLEEHKKLWTAVSHHSKNHINRLYINSIF